VESLPVQEAEKALGAREARSRGPQRGYLSPRLLKKGRTQQGRTQRLA
jgi:hypothetical protein